MIRPRHRIQCRLGLGLLTPWLAAVPFGWSGETAAAAPLTQSGPAALIQLAGAPLEGGTLRGEARLPLERAAGGDTPVLSLRLAAAAGRPDAAAGVRLLLDTGASATMVTPQLAARLGLTTTALPPQAFALAGGGAGCAALEPRRARLPDLLLAGGDGSSGGQAGGPSGPGRDGLLLQGIEALVLPVAALPEGVDGVLGAPSLRRLPILIDPGRNRLILGASAPAAFRTGRAAAAAGGTRAASKAAGDEPATLRVPLRWAHGVPLLSLDSQAGPVQALADTGAEGLFLSPELAARLQPSGPAQQMRLVGVCGEQLVQRRRFRGLTLPGGAGDAAPEGIVTDNPVFAGLKVEAIAGQEWLRRRTQLWRLDLNPPQLLLR